MYNFLKPYKLEVVSTMLALAALGLDGRLAAVPPGQEHLPPREAA